MWIKWDSNWICNTFIYCWTLICIRFKQYTQWLDIPEGTVQKHLQIWRFPFTALIGKRFDKVIITYMWHYSNEICLCNSGFGWVFFRKVEVTDWSCSSWTVSLPPCLCCGLFFFSKFKACNVIAWTLIKKFIFLVIYKQG